ncbi:hypothetical protein ACWGCI_10665 [Streptomyces sp. NPDC054949]
MNAKLDVFHARQDAERAEKCTDWMDEVSEIRAELDQLPFLTPDEVDALLSPYARHDEREQMRRREQAVRNLSENRYALMEEINQWINGRGLLVRALVAVVFAVLKGYHLVRGLLRRQNS